MQPVLLPSASYYFSVDREVLRAAMARIDEQVRDLLQNGAQAQGVPPGIYAAGQHLNPYSMNQRGLYGTSACLLVLSRRGPSPGRIELIEGLIKYVNERPAVERALATTDEDVAMLTARISIEWRTAFKCAELLYALAVAPPAAVGREKLLRSVLTRLTEGRRPAGGWAADLDPHRAHDALATASVVRGLHAAGIPVTADDLNIVRADVADGSPVNRYVRSFCLLVLLEVAGVDSVARGRWNVLLAEFRPQLGDRTEANYEFTLGNRQYYIRIPWQLYLLAGTALCRPLDIVAKSAVRNILLDCIKAVGSADGYIYPAFGHMKSTRTYGILMDTLWRVAQELDSSRYLAGLASVANSVVRVVYSRSASWVALLAALALAGMALRGWLAGQHAPLGALGPEIGAALLLGLAGFFLRRVRAKRL
jgi:hypothetical protein